ncbi:hypothetical protein [Bacillus cereus]|uniref:hypothetical protein n=1 Tax=Bacillus cereus group TaxID=86661 RepID=UPI00159BA4DE|nr:hypothetical protein [Bacillus cereus]HDR4559402.1 hypothetical protein [Bacillus luti]
MSLASYIGCNVKIPLTNPDSNNLIVFGSYFSDDSAREVVQVGKRLFVSSTNQKHT